MKSESEAGGAAVRAFLAAIEPVRKREDAERLTALMQQVSGHGPVLWGPNMIGFDRYHYRYESGREGDSFRLGFSPRKDNLVIYLGSEFADSEELLARLGRFKTGKACLYIRKLADVDERMLEALLTEALRRSLSQYA